MQALLLSALLLPLPQAARRCGSLRCRAAAAAGESGVAISQLSAALHESLSAPSSLSDGLFRKRDEVASLSESHGRWLRIASCLCDAVCELAAEAAAAAEGRPPQEEALAAARALCSGVLARCAAEAPAVYAVAKFSAKRNEGLRTRRGVERCLAELGLLLGTLAALTPEEADELLGSLRPLTRTAPSSARVACFLVLCRGFTSPGAAFRWRSGGGTVQQRLEAEARPPRLGEALEARPELSEHSQALRATLPFLETPLRLWLASLPPEARPEGSGSGSGAALLVLRLAGCGEEGRVLLRALQAWAVERLLAAVGVGGDREEVSAAVLARSRGSEVALLLCASHGALVRGGVRPQQKWVEGAERLGHEVWLLVQACDGAGDGARQGGAEAEAEAADEAARALEGVRGVMLACCVLERAGELRPRYRAALSRAGTAPSCLLHLVGEALGSQLEREGEGGEGASHRPADAACLSRLKGWRRPELLFNYLALHADDDAIAPLARRWLTAVLGLGGESVAELRLREPLNRRHLDAIAATGARARRAVRLWRVADARGAEGGGEAERGGEAEGAAAVLPGGCGAEELFMSGHELRSCLRIDKQCARENKALLGLVAQGNVRLLRVRDAKGRTLARAAARLLARRDTHAPLLLVDQPLFAGRCDEGTQRPRLEAELLRQAARLAARLRVPLLRWREVVGPAVAAAGGEEGKAEALSAVRIALVELGGVAPFIYSNLNGLMERDEDGVVTHALVEPAVLDRDPSCSCAAQSRAARKPLRLENEERI